VASVVYVLLQRAIRSSTHRGDRENSQHYCLTREAKITLAISLEAVVGTSGIYSLKRRKEKEGRGGKNRKEEEQKPYTYHPSFVRDIWHQQSTPRDQLQ
jgi:hypothetical protein